MIRLLRFNIGRFCILLLSTVLCLSIAINAQESLDIHHFPSGAERAVIPATGERLILSVGMPYGIVKSGFNSGTDTLSVGFLPTLPNILNNNNLPPVPLPADTIRISIADSARGVPLDLDNYFVDPESSPLRYVSQSLDEAILIITTDSLDPTHIFLYPQQTGLADIRVEATDNWGLSDSTELKVEILDNAGPILEDPIPDLTQVVTVDSVVLDLNQYFRDPDGDVITYTVATINSEIVSASINGSSLKVVPLCEGETRVNITAVDIGRSNIPVTANFNTSVTFPPLASTIAISASYSRADDVFDARNYRLIGIPGNSGIDVRSSELTGVQGTNWDIYADIVSGGENRFARYNDDGTFTFTVGKGFWAISDKDYRFSSLNQTNAILTAEQMVEIPLQDGWNIISNPFDVAIPWSDVLAANGITNEPLHSYSGMFNTTDTFAPNRGYYFDNKSDASVLKIPYRSIFCPGTIPAPLLSLDWEARLAVGSAGLTDSSLWIGVDAEAASGLDLLDSRKPFGINGLQSSFLVEDEQGRSISLGRAIQPAEQPVQEWNFSVRSAPGMNTQISINSLRFENEAPSLFLLREGTERLILMEEGSAFEFTATETHSNFKIFAGKRSDIESLIDSGLPTTFELGQNYPNPFNPSTFIPVAIPVKSDIKLVVYNVLGQRVRVLFDSALEAGRYRFEWDGRNDFGSRVSSGMYIYRLTTQEREFTNKMILMK